jgi:hypothetical protein
MVHIKYKYIYSEISSTSKQVHLSETLKYTKIQVHLSENPSVPKVYLGENLSTPKYMYTSMKTRVHMYWKRKYTEVCLVVKQK